MQIAMNIEKFHFDKNANEIIIIEIIDSFKMMKIAKKMHTTRKTFFIVKMCDGLDIRFSSSTEYYTERRCSMFQLILSTDLTLNDFSEKLELKKKRFIIRVTILS